MNATVKEKRHRGPRIRGIGEDAETLCVSRMHLWQVLKGQRQSQSLRARYQALKQSQKDERMKKTVKLSPQGRAPMPIEFAALQNLQPSFFQTLTTLGLEVVLVRISGQWRAVRPDKRNTGSYHAPGSEQKPCERPFKEGCFT